MGRISQFMGENIDWKKEEDVTQQEEKDIESIGDLISSNQEAMDQELMSLLETYFTQVLGHYGQVLIRSEHILPKEKWEEYTKTKEELDASMQKKETLHQEEWKQLTSKVLQLYQTVTADITHSLEEKKQNEGIENEISVAKDFLYKIDQVVKEDDSSKDDWIRKILALYQSSLNEIDKEKKREIIKQLVEEEKQFLQSNEEKQQQMGTERIFDLFAKINDQIVSSKHQKNGNKIYAMYTLEDGSFYYAIIKDEKTVLDEDQAFVTKLPPIQLNRTSVEDLMKTIIQNAIAYYDLNEYMRYIEMSYKSVMSKEIDQVVMQYKTRLTNREQALKQQLQFMEDFSYILNGKPSEKYPNIVYQDTKPMDFYPKESSGGMVEEAVVEQRKLIQDVLGNETVAKKFTNKDILLAMYGKSEVESLLQNHFNQEDAKAKQAVAIEKVEENNLSVSLETNPEKIHKYLEERKEDIKNIKEGKSQSSSIQEQKDNLYQEINTIFRIDTAKVISDKQYQEGQGLYAIVRYLKTGEVTAFTSSSQARDLASSVDRRAYLSILMENMIKSLAGSGRKQKDDPTYMDRMGSVLSFTQKCLENETFSPMDMSVSLLQNPDVLSLAISNFDYDYLDPLSDVSKLFDEKIEEGVKASNPTAIKFQKAMDRIKSFSKDQNITIPAITEDQKAVA